jgi:hypothetical protein
VGTFTSHTEEIESTFQLYEVITTHANQGHCLLKGDLTRPLRNEARRGSTRTDDATGYICLDWDRHACSDLDSELTLMGLGDVSYVLQYSASHGLSDNDGTVSAHVFMRLSEKRAAPFLKAWLMSMNLTHFAEGIRLSRTKNTLSWPLDISTCQNDKMLYIAPPVFKGMADPLTKRITYVQREFDRIPVERLGECNIAVLKTNAQKLLNTRRKEEGLTSRTAKTTWVGAIEVLNKPDVATVTGVKHTGEFTRLNLNGGDSWAYWHPVANFELIHDFKADCWYRTKELLPGYYADLVDASREQAATPNKNGDLILAFRDIKTDTYYNGVWNPGKQRLDMYAAKDKMRLDHWMQSHGLTPHEFIPIWDVDYDPEVDWIVDEEAHKINTFVPSLYMNQQPRHNAEFPRILNIVRHMLGWKGPADNDLVEHFLNWFACIFQRKHKPLTAWVCHGNQGTGKGYFVKRIASVLLGLRNTQTVVIGNIEDQFNGWLEGKLFVFVDEVDVNDFSEKGRVTSKLKNYITEPTIPLRRMRQQTVDVKNYVSFLFSSNRPQPVQIDESDRRYNIGNFQGLKLPRPEDAAIEEELIAFAQYLLAHKADVIASNSIIETLARERIKKLGVSSIDITCYSILEGDFESLWLTMPDEELMMASRVDNDVTRVAQAYCVLLKNIVREGFPNKLTRDELQIILQYNVGNMPTAPNKFTSLLRHHSIETKQIRKGERKTYGIDVDWQVDPEFRLELETQLIPKSKRVSRVK